MPRWQRNLLILIAVLLVLTGAWIFVARPLIHQSVDSQIESGLQSAVDQVPFLPLDKPQYTLLQGEIDNYIALNSSQLSPVTDLQISLQANLIVATFKTFGVGSTVQFNIGVASGKAIATDVSVSGLISLVESADELTARLDDALGQLNGKVERQFVSVQIMPGELVFNLAQSSQP